MSLTCAQNLSRFSNQDEGFLEVSANLVGASVAHCQLIVVSKFIEKLKQDIPGDGVKEQLQALCSIYALSIIKKRITSLQSKLPLQMISSDPYSLRSVQMR